VLILLIFVVNLLVLRKLLTESLYAVIFLKSEKSQYIIFLLSFVFSTFNLVGFQCRAHYLLSYRLLSHLKPAGLNVRSRCLTFVSIM